MDRFLVGLKFDFSQWKIHFSQFIFIDEYLKFTELNVYFIYYIKFEMWPALFYVNYINIQKQNSIYSQI